MIFEGQEILVMVLQYKEKKKEVDQVIHKQAQACVIRKGIKLNYIMLFSK